MGDAEKVLSAVLKKNGSDVDALMQRSRIYLGSGKYAEAQTDLEPGSALPERVGGSALSSREGGPGPGRAARQRQELGQALRKDPDYLAARFELAQLLTCQRRRASLARTAG